MPAETIDDLDEYARAWAIESYKMARTWRQKMIPMNQLEINISWKRVKIEHSEPKFTVPKAPPGPKPENLFHTRFTNNTAETQEYSFRTERTTCSTCEATLEEAFSIGGEISIGFKCPGDFLEAGAEFKREMTITKSSGTVEEKTVTWSVDQTIKVPPSSETEAKLNIEVNNRSGKFEIETTLTGKVTATVTNMAKNNCLVMGLEGSISDIVKKFKERQRLQNYTVDKNVVRVTTKGSCDFQFAQKQAIVLTNYKK